MPFYNSSADPFKVNPPKIVKKKLPPSSLAPNTAQSGNRSTENNSDKKPDHTDIEPPVIRKRSMQKRRRKRTKKNKESGKSFLNKDISLLKCRQPAVDPTSGPPLLTPFLG